MAVLVVNDLRAGVGGKEILTGISVKVGGGEVHVIMGPNGSGKSTLANVIAGHPDYQVFGGGVAIQDGKTTVDLLSLSPDDRAKEGIFLSFQNPVAIEGVSVFDLLKTTLKMKKGKDAVSIVEFYKTMKETAGRLGLTEDFLKRSLNDGFSGGEKKKAETMQLLLIKPKFAILDELDTGLDVGAIKVVARGIMTAVEEGMGVLIITHNSRLLRYIKPTKIHVMKQGKIVQSGGEGLVTLIENGGYEKVA
jgi:Fe-S cluster assembly ATP-binding protein